MLFLEKETIIGWVISAVFGTLILIFAIFCSVKVLQINHKYDKVVKQNDKILAKHKQLVVKMSMKDDIFVKDNVRFYLSKSL